MKDSPRPTLPDQVWRTDALSDRLGQYLGDQLGKPVAISELRRFTAGLSWITISFRMAPQGDAAADAILRIGDPNGLLAPYSTQPETLTFTRLRAETDVPVPKVMWACEDDTVLGAPFLIVTRMQGEVLL
ncbi:MAG: phosphotransferase, partial [Pseudomonadota bacterium]|nr:phosphotransferase [Pseudomonadota bacterium]